LRRLRLGSAAVEFALTLPIGLTILAGSVDGGMFMVESTVAARAARDGARVGSMTLEPPPANGDLIEAAARSAALSSLNAAGAAADAVVSATWFQDEDGVSWLQVDVSTPHVSFFGSMTPFSGTVQHRFFTVTQEQL
jgi:Flp pilus assembly protein TadG